MPPRSASYWEGKGLLGCAGGLSCFEEEAPQVSGACGKLPGSMESPARVNPTQRNETLPIAAACLNLSKSGLTLAPPSISYCWSARIA
jgi:hypothetical protein